MELGWNESMEIVNEKFSKTDEEIVNNSVSQMAEDVHEFYFQNQALDLSQFQGGIYKILHEKFSFNVNIHGIL